MEIEVRCVLCQRKFIIDDYQLTENRKSNVCLDCIRENQRGHKVR